MMSAGQIEVDASWLEEARCEALWQMGNWQEAPEPSVQQVRQGNSFHATVCAALKVHLQGLPP